MDDRHIIDAEFEDITHQVRVLPTAAAQPQGYVVRLSPIALVCIWVGTELFVLMAAALIILGNGRSPLTVALAYGLAAVPILALLMAAARWAIRNRRRIVEDWKWPQRPAGTESWTEEQFQAWRKMPLWKRYRWFDWRGAIRSLPFLLAFAIARAVAGHH